ncbi:unnamed protein product [Didymodactylos carnosus]|uniref:Uncharacterized protein n=1 Tax=Didymodactylos carnosus TaxID=1234261 RepID=A0A8S2H3C1_9BILA|nr:unnamed protein product [Didymodactylos carnosus]CAF3594763.1 unnamed protein product [Didymodactylos carnosus]
MGLGALTLVFAIVSIATPGWPGSTSLYRPTVENKSAAALGVLSVLLIAAALVLTGFTMLRKTSSIFILLAIIVLFLASLFALGTIVSVSTNNHSIGYSYNLMTTAHVFLSIAAIAAAVAYGFLFFDTHLSYASEYPKHSLDLNNTINQKLNDKVIILNTVTNSYEINSNGPNSERDELVSAVGASVKLIRSLANTISESITLKRTPLKTSNLQSVNQLDSLSINTLLSRDGTTTQRQHSSFVIVKKKREL